MSRRHKKQPGGRPQDGQMELPNAGKAAPGDAAGDSTTDTVQNFASILGDDWRQQVEDARREPGINDTVTNLSAEDIRRATEAAAASQSRPGGGDTLRMPSIKPGTTAPPPSGPAGGGAKGTPGETRRPVQPRMPAGLRKRLLREQTRVSHVPVRRRRLRGFGFFYWLMGFFGFIFRMVLATAIVMGLATAIGYYGVKAYISTNEEVVPNVKGTRLETAVDILSEKGLSVVKDRSEPSALVAPGEIIDQRPPAGQKAKRGSTIYVDVASGRARFVVPDVLGESRDSAMNKIRGANLDLGDVAFIESDKPVDTVINQNPEPNKGLDAPVKVDLLLSTGPRGRALAMPDLQGRTLADAKSALAAIGITNITTDPAGAASGTIASHTPPAGRSIVQTERVTLKVTP